MRAPVRERAWLSVRGAIDLRRTAGFLHSGDAGDLRFTGRGFRAAVRCGEGVALVALQPAKGGVEAEMLLGPRADAGLALAAARQLAGLPRDPSHPDPHAAFVRAARSVPALAPILRACRGLRLPQRPDAAACVVSAILAQQVTGSFAAELARRVREGWGERVTIDGEEWLLPARAEVLATLQPADLRPLQVSTRKAEYIRDLSQEIAEGRLDLPALAPLPWDEASAQLVARRGIGPTTAAWLLAFGAGHADAWPPADAGLLKALAILVGRREGRAVERLLAGFAGSRSLLAVHLWEALRLRLLR